MAWAWLMAVGCGESSTLPGPFGPGELTDVEAWSVVNATDDPFEDRPDTIQCNPGGYHPEGDVYEVETDKCGYVTVVQPSLRTIVAGDVVASEMWHQFLDADEPAEAHMAVRIGPHVINEQRIAVPFAPRFYRSEWTAPTDVPAGTPVYLHVHNHGSNSYRFGAPEIVTGASSVR